MAIIENQSFVGLFGLFNIFQIRYNSGSAFWISGAKRVIYAKSGFDL